MAHALLVRDIDVKVSEHHDSTGTPNAVAASAELARLHVALHDVHAIFLVKRDAGYLIEADDVVLADKTALTGRVVDEHAGHGCLSTRYQMRVGRNLLK